MIEATVGELLDGDLEVDTRGHYIYIVRDDDTVFYVGQTKRGIGNRIREHCGAGQRPGKTRMGRLIESNLPLSLGWQVELLTVKDCGIEPWRPNVSQEEMSRFAREIEQPMIAFLPPAPDWFASSLEVDKAEDTMILRYHPCLNCTHNLDSKPLPERYRTLELDLDTTVSNFIPF